MHPNVWVLLDTVLWQGVTRHCRRPFTGGCSHQSQRVLSRVLCCSAWRWWLPTHTKQEQERMVEAALAAQPCEEGMRTEFAVL